MVVVGWTPCATSTFWNVYNTEDATLAHVCSLAYWTIASACHVFFRAAAIPAASSRSSRFVTIPRLLEQMISGMPPASVATTGIPLARASSTTFGQPSLLLARQKRSAALYQKH